MGIRQCPNDRVPEMDHLLFLWTEKVTSVSGIALVWRFSPCLISELWNVTVGAAVPWGCVAALGCLAPGQAWWVLLLVSLHPLPPPGEGRCFSESKRLLTLCSWELGAKAIRGLWQSRCFSLCFCTSLRRLVGELALKLAGSLLVGITGLW